MVDVVDPATRSRMMAGIRGKNTRPEVQIRSALHLAGFRFRLHDRSLPGSPDLVLPKYRAVIFVHGCFWHRHQGCTYAKIPATRREFWLAKFEANQERDLRARKALLDAGWRVFTIWGCGVRHDLQEVISGVSRALNDQGVIAREFPLVPSIKT